LQLELAQLEEPDFDQPGFPQHDTSHTLIFTTAAQASAFFDVLGYRDRIIQVRLTVQSSECSKHIDVILPLLVARYGPGTRLAPDSPLMFADEKTDAYLSRIPIGSSETLFVNVGDREVWRLAGGEVTMVELEKPSVSETAIARQFVLNVLQAVEESWPRLRRESLCDLFQDPTVLDSEAAPYEFAFAAAAVQIQALSNLFPADQAARIRSHVVDRLCAFASGPYPAGAIEEYQAAWDRSLQMAEYPWFGVAAVLFDRLASDVASDPRTIRPMLLCAGRCGHRMWRPVRENGGI
jgi:hypothetical protein